MYFLIEAAKSIGAVLNSLLHGQPLAAWMFGSYNCIDIVLTLDAVVEA